MKPIFVYGILKHRYANAQQALVPRFRLVDMGWFPAAIPAPTGAIKGELIFVSDETIQEFDMIEGHPNFYVRTDVEVEIGEGNQVEMVKAQMYVINEEYHGRISEPTMKLDIDEDENHDLLYEYHP
jgi:gamma-glutamylcyclotransferase (GGCT)/AIG2-like uncharacterized protein YtfP